jgi:Poly(3-hydroxybutyrate) depolymerase
VKSTRLQLDADIASATLGVIPRTIRAGIGTAFNAGTIERVSTALGFGTTLDAIGAKYKSMSEVPANFIDKSIENGASSPLMVSAFLSKRFADFDLDGNNFLSKSELNRIRTSDLWSRSLSNSETKMIDEAKRYGRRINEANDDEFLWEKSGMSKQDLVAFGLTHVKNVDEMPKEPGDYLKMAQVGDDPRQYLIHIPPSYDGTKKVPLMIFLHPFMGSAESAADLTAFNKKADEEGFIAIYPNGRFCKASGIRAWNITDFPNFMSSDTDFVGTIMETAKEGLEIDPSKIFVAGYSNGGMLAQDIATKFSDKVAAVACVSGCMTGLESGPTEDVSVLMIHGGKDKVVPYDGRLGWFNEIGLPAMRSVDYARNFWTTNDNLTEVERQKVKDGVQFERWTNPNKKVELQIYTLDEIKHRYPGGNYGASNVVPETIEATNVIWDFFKAHGKGNPKAEQKLPAVFQDFPRTDSKLLSA